MIHDSLLEQAAVPSCQVCAGECRGLAAGGCAGRTRVLRALWAMLYPGAGWFEILIGNRPQHVRTEEMAEFVTTLAGAARLREHVRLGAAATSSIDAPGAYVSRVLWARVETSKAATLLEAFKPEPTLVLRDGDNVKRTAFWELHKPLGAWWLLTANERLSHRLEGVRAAADPGFAFPPPFAPLARDRHVVVERFQPVYYRADQVVGEARPDCRALPDAPARDAWRQNKPVAQAA